MRTAGIVLCGGRSSRMGASKAWLPFGSEFMLPRVVSVVRAAVAPNPVVVVAAPGQDLPQLPDGVTIARDEEEGNGPLAGLAAGLAALEGLADAAYLSSCDVPFLKMEFVRRVIELLEEPNPPAEAPTPPAPLPEGKGEEDLRNSVTSGEVQDAWRAFPPFPSGRGAGGVGSSARRGGLPSVAVPLVNDRLHPLAAAYRLEVLPVVRAMLAADRLRMIDLFAAVPTRAIGAEELRDTDAECRSLCNLNTPEEYDAALRTLGLPPRGSHCC